MLDVTFKTEKFSLAKLERIEKRFKSVVFQQFKRSITKGRRMFSRHVRKNTGIAKSAPKIFNNYTKQKINYGSDIDNLLGEMIFNKSGLTLIQFAYSRNRATRTKGIAISRRKPPVIRVYKGQKTHLKKGFYKSTGKSKSLQEDKAKSGNKSNIQVYRKIRKGRGNYETHVTRSVSLVTLASKTLTLDQLTLRTSADILKKIKRKMRYVFAA